MLVTLGYNINHNRVEQIWKESGLKLPMKQPKRQKLWLNNVNVFRFRPEYNYHV
jgi:hypothetical protein